ncbi:hypothetical protein C7974DRAFT_311766 [Boeremia exigua]|uniref:uncharacterized protein n=1 Tax=Boeremia exigua TaxID=749465 RepID=UPI001E8DF882|nr:uncharacterized protein C7974DRAFT_311766 [Boeremia exigua]KAH6629155.1 hypothetical protein C7974DRAFT_311766 [Boeremia exigua]
MAAAETRRLLEQLMGEQLMSGSDQRAPQLSITDPKVCRSYLVGNCPHDLFTNTKNELGPCPKVHNEALKTEYQEADAEQKRRWGFDFDYLRDMQHHIDGCNRKIDQAQRRLEKTPEEIRQTNAHLKAINEYSKSIEAGILEVQIMGEEGLVNMAVWEYKNVREKKVAKEEKERELRALSDTGGPSGHQKLQVCDVCGAYLSRLDNDRRLADHFYGKMHLGYAQMRKSYESLQKELKGRAPPRDAYPSQGDDRGWGGGGYGGGGGFGGRGGRRGRVTNNVLNLEIDDAYTGSTPSSEYLASLRQNAVRRVKRQKDADADVYEDLITLGGRVYMTRITLGSRVYSLVLDTGSSDTWVAQASFTCKDPNGNPIPIAVCRFAYYPPVFSLALNRTSSARGAPSKAPGGLLAIGGIPDVDHDPSSWSETSILPVSASVYTYYSIRIDGYSITAPAGSPIVPKNFSASPQSIIVDSGTTLIYLPDRVADYIASLFVPRAVFNAQSGLYIVSCSAVAPRVGVTIAGVTYFVSDDDLMNRGSGAVSGPGTGAGTGQCVLAIQPTMGGAAVLGDSWLKNVLVVFDLGGNKVRVAAREVY